MADACGDKRERSPLERAKLMLDAKVVVDHYNRIVGKIKDGDDPATPLDPEADFVITVVDYETLRDFALQERGEATPSHVSSSGDGKLTEPAWIGNTSFGAGCSERLVIERAQREFKYQTAPEREKERIERGAKALAEFQAAVSTTRRISPLRTCEHGVVYGDLCRQCTARADESDWHQLYQHEVDRRETLERELAEAKESIATLASRAAVERGAIFIVETTPSAIAPRQLELEALLEQWECYSHPFGSPEPITDPKIVRARIDELLVGLRRLRPLVEEREQLEIPTSPGKEHAGWRAWLHWLDRVTKSDADAQNNRADGSTQTQEPK